MRKEAHDVGSKLDFFVQPPSKFVDFRCLRCRSGNFQKLSVFDAFLNPIAEFRISTQRKLAMKSNRPASNRN